MRQPVELIVDFEIRYLFNSNNRIDKPCKNTKTGPATRRSAIAAEEPLKTTVHLSRFRTECR